MRDDEKFRKASVHAGIYLLLIFLILLFAFAGPGLNYVEQLSIDHHLETSEK